MKRHGSWTAAELARLRQLVEEKASAARASAALGRTIIAVQIKAKSLGTPFVPARKLRAARLAREAASLCSAVRDESTRA